MNTIYRHTIFLSAALQLTLQPIPKVEASSHVVLRTPQTADVTSIPLLQFSRKISSEQSCLFVGAENTPIDIAMFLTAGTNVGRRKLRAGDVIVVLADQQFEMLYRKNKAIPLTNGRLKVYARNRKVIESLRPLTFQLAVLCNS